MDISFYISNDEPNKIHKRLSGGVVLSGTLKEGSSIVNPVILIQSSVDIVDYNYAHISSFSRYYYIIDFKSVRNNLWEVTMKSDPLMSFANELQHCAVILEKSSEVDSKASPYIKTEANVILSKRLTDIVPFEQGFNEDGEFILITAGGFAP